MEAFLSGSDSDSVGGEEVKELIKQEEEIKERKEA